MLIQERSRTQFCEQIGKYHCIAQAASGGMGIVYLAATHGPAGFSKLVAVKELRPDLAQEASYVTMFLDEGRMAARFDHPNIVQTLEADQSEGRFYIVMEYLDGRSLHRILQKLSPQRGFPTWMSLSILCDVLSALDYVHAFTDAEGKPIGFVHRDVSPHNVFVTFAGHTKVIDFGIAKGRDSSQETRAGVLKGKLGYMAPEQLAHHTSRSSDIFSVGAILFEIVTGRKLWEGMSDVEIFSHLNRGDILSNHDVGTTAQVPLLDVCQKALSPRPQDRYATAADMRDAIADYLWSTSGFRQVHAKQEIGAKLMEAFGSEREATRTLIKSYFAQLGGDHEEPLPTIMPSAPSASTRTSVSVYSLLRPVAPGADAEEFTESRADIRFPMVTLPPRPSEVEVNVPALFSSHGKAIAIIAGTIAVIGFIIGFSSRRESQSAAPPPWTEMAPRPLAVAAPAPTPTPAARPPSPSSQASSSALPETVVLSVTVAPPSADLFIDGEPLPSNPFFSRFPKSTTLHRIRATAKGYQSKERLVRFVDNVLLDLSLSANPSPKPEPREPSPPRREQAPTRRSPAAAAPGLAPPAIAPVRTASSPDITPRGEWERPRRRRIDANNPYGEEP